MQILNIVGENEGSGRCTIRGKTTYEAGSYEDINDTDNEVYKKQNIAKIK